MRRTAIVTSIYCLLSTGNAVTYVSTVSDAALLQYTESNGSVLGNFYFTSGNYRTSVKTVSFAVEGIKNGSDISLKLIENSSHATNVFGTVKGHFLFLDIFGKALVFQLGPKSVYDARVAEIALEARKFQAQAAKNQQQQNQADAAASGVRDAQARTLTPFIEKVNTASKSLDALMTDVDQFQEPSEIFDQYFTRAVIAQMLSDAEKVVKVVKDTNKGCVDFRSVRLDSLEQAIETTNQIAKSAPSYSRELSSRINALDAALVLYRGSLKLNPKSGLVVVDRKTAGARNALSMLKTLSAKSAYMLSDYATIHSRFQSVNADYESLKSRCPGDN